MALRFAIALPALLALLIINRVKIDIGKHKWRLAWASVVIAAHFIIQITGIKYTSATNTGWIIAIIPLIVALLAAIFLKEKLTWKIAVGITVATVGIVFLISKGKIGELSWLSSYGDWLVLGSAHTWAIYTILTRDISRALNPLVVAFVLLIPSTVISVTSVIAFSDLNKFTTLPVEAVVALLFLGILGTALGHWFWQLGVARVGASRAGIFLYLEPIATTMVAVPYLKEPLGAFTIIGGLAVLAGVWISQR
jgi:drug/metabolite transporter (DMT)-like permease